MLNTKKESTMKKQFYFFAVLITILIGCGKEDNISNSESYYSNTNAQTLVHDGINREYVLYIPNSYDGTSAVPLMLNFHGVVNSKDKKMASKEAIFDCSNVN